MQHAHHLHACMSFGGTSHSKSALCLVNMHAKGETRGRGRARLQIETHLQAVQQTQAARHQVVARREARAAQPEVARIREEPAQ